MLLKLIITIENAILSLVQASEPITMKNENVTNLFSYIAPWILLHVYNKLNDKISSTTEKKKTDLTTANNNNTNQMSFYLSWAIVWIRLLCSVMHNDSEQMVTQPNDRTNNKEKREMGTQKEAETTKTTIYLEREEKKTEKLTHIKK